MCKCISYIHLGKSISDTSVYVYQTHFRMYLRSIYVCILDASVNASQMDVGLKCIPDPFLIMQLRCLWGVISDTFFNASQIHKQLHRMYIWEYISDPILNASQILLQKCIWYETIENLPGMHSGNPSQMHPSEPLSTVATEGFHGEATVVLEKQDICCLRFMLLVHCDIPC